MLSKFFVDDENCNLLIFIELMIYLEIYLAIGPAIDAP